MEQDFIDSIQKMIKEYGKDIFLDARKAKPMIGDYTRNQFQKETNLLKQLLDSNCAKMINEAGNVADAKAVLIKRLEDEHYISPKGSAEMLDMLGFVLRGDISKAVLSTDGTEKPKAEPERTREELTIKNTRNDPTASSSAITKWLCEVCGFVHTGDAPPVHCPQCLCPPSKFKKYKN